MRDLLNDLNNLREQLGLSYDQLAERTNVSKTTLSRLFHGEGDPRLQTVIDAARGLGAKLLISTEKSRQAFYEGNIQPFREILAEKERVIVSKDESIKRYEQHIQYLHQREEQSQKRQSRTLVAFIILLSLVIAVVILDISIGTIGYIRY